ncbi:hypothetical protein [Streptomyces sp. WMMC897]|uniref:hypothetical protein n=1 Tax=Streptomyces sp. WMMC897 TaxID=3014782 RepID=UPI0022B680B4|nr:hypothetical protein [Streptomyces sp. WMMC897]MCZ7413027.1 hypothetical protein [Streptomyces sp. WMMC897]MCZ7413091.1 hypothetical protein [Streptomyces sp. WMMC897]MCZ7415437.1 hypothetical protein [Streptomyces sp. WMMC897]
MPDLTRVTLTPEHGRAILHAVEGTEARAAVALMFAAGLHGREVVALRLPADYDREAGVLRVRGETPRTIRLAAVCRTALDAVLRIPLSPWGPWRGSVTTRSGTLVRALHRAGLAGDIHAPRHLALRLAWEAHADPLRIAHYFGVDGALPPAGEVCDHGIPAALDQALR